MGAGARTGPATWARKSGAGRSGMMNDIVDDVTNVSGRVCDRMLLKKFIRYNFGRDKLFGRASKHGTPGWSWIERAANAAALGVVSGVPFPRARACPDVSRKHLSSFVCSICLFFAFFCFLRVR